MCNYWHGGTVECRGDGFMWDADSDGYDPDDHSMACPACNTSVWLADAKEHSECTSYSSGHWGYMTGADMWLNAITIALRANPEKAPRLIRKIGIVRPLTDEPCNDTAFAELFFDNRQQRHIVSRNRREGLFEKRIFNLVRRAA